MAGSIEKSEVRPWAERQIEALGWEHGAEQGGRQTDRLVDGALRQAPTKDGGNGVNAPDHVIIVADGATRVPVLCEWKGAKGRLRDKKAVVLKDMDGGYRYGQKGIDKFASLGAAYYASKVVSYPGGHKLALAIAANGYRRASSDVEPTYEVAVYAVSSDDSDKVVWVGDYSDMSFLAATNWASLLQEVNDALDPLAAKLRKEKASSSLDEGLKRLNQFLHTEHGILPGHRVNVVTALLIASLGVDDGQGHWIVKPLSSDELYGGKGNSSDGSVIFRRVEDYLKQRTPQLPTDKQESVLNALRSTLLDSNLSSLHTKGMSPLKEAFSIMSSGLLPHYHDNVRIDFTGKLFNEMFAWIDVPDAGANDVVLTPRRTTDLMVQLTRVDAQSYVWDWTLGTGTFLISAMNAMIADAQTKYQGDAFRKKENQIKVDQLLGIEKLEPIYVLAVLNMILMGDGSTNIIHGNSHQFDGKYQDRNITFPATTLLLNPPYSAAGNGLIFVQEAFAKMNEQKTGKYGAVIIQDSAGSGKAVEFCRSILQDSTLEASIKMPADLFIGKSGVQTSIYVFRLGQPHPANQLVKFIDFRNDGYKRSNRKKVKDPSINLRPVSDPDGRYAEVVAIVTGCRRETSYYPTGELYFEDTIDPKAGNDWNYDQHISVDTKPSMDDFRHTVSDYMAWEVDQLLNRSDIPRVVSHPMDADLLALEVKHGVVGWRETPITSLFSLDEKMRTILVRDIVEGSGDIPFVTAKSTNNGVASYISYNDSLKVDGNCIFIGGKTLIITYQEQAFFTNDGHNFALRLKELEHSTKLTQLFLVAALKRSLSHLYTWGGSISREKIQNDRLQIPVLADSTPAWDYMEACARMLESERIRTLENEHARAIEAYLRVAGLSASDIG
ncbi:MAG: N-6 DNA methylase [Propionibacteriaceae bacterium]|jgi:hypothetical protein|nr:N-6 DNA methylase [Propionibacteriaceae bacterium]